MDPSRPSADTDAWLAALGGRMNRPLDPAEAAAFAEGSLLRTASRRWPEPTPIADAAADAAALAALLAAARRDGRIAARSGCSRCQVFAEWWGRRWRAGAATLVLAAGAAAFVLAPRLASPTDPAPNAAAETLRGARTEGVQRLHAVDPGALRDRIADDLRDAGMEVTRYERLGRYGLDAELPPGRRDEWAALLARYGLVLPPSGGLAVEIDAAP